MARLDALAGELATRGWTTSIRTRPGRPPSLHARNPDPEATALSEHICALPKPDGSWAYWWPWADPIADNPADAATTIIHVLGPA